VIRSRFSVSPLATATGKVNPNPNLLKVIQFRGLPYGKVVNTHFHYNGDGIYTALQQQQLI